MAASSNSHLAPVQAQQNSPRSWQSRRTSSARGLTSPTGSSPSPSLSGLADQEQLDTSASFKLPPQEASAQLEDDWAHGTGGVDVEPEISESGGAAKKPVWNKPSGAISEVAVVMGAESWPALSESARATPKAAPPDSLKAVPRGSQTISPVSQVTAEGSVAPYKEVTNSMSAPNSSSTTVMPTRQRSMKRVGGSSSHTSTAANGSLSQAPNTQIVAEMPPANPGKSGGSVGESFRDITHRDGGHRSGSYGGNEVQQPHNSFRRNNNGPQSRGDGSYHHNHGSRRDQERGKQDWGNSHRNFGGRESHGHGPQQRAGTRPFIRGPAPNSSFMPPSPVAVRPFITPMVYAEVPSPVYFVAGPHPDALRPMPMVPISPVFFPMPDPHLPSKIVNQIDYYFSSENLVKDTFLRQNMDGDGWVPVKLIASFKKVMQLTDNIQLILDAIQASNVVEVQGDKVRRRSDWVKWIMPSTVYSTVTSPQSTTKSSPDVLAAHLNSVNLDEQGAT